MSPEPTRGSPVRRPVRSKEIRWRRPASTLWTTIAPFIFNILCIPAAASLDTPSGLTTVVSDATRVLHDKRAFLIVDIPEDVDTPADMVYAGWRRTARFAARNAAVYFPRLDDPDPLNDNRPRNVGPSGTLAGVYARTDATRGVWKAPAGTEADLRGANLAAQDHRRRKRWTEPARHQRAAHLPDLRQRQLGRAHARRRRLSRRANGSTSRSAGLRCTSRRACSRDRSGSSSSRTTSRSGRRSA